MNVEFTMRSASLAPSVHMPASWSSLTNVMPMAIVLRGTLTCREVGFKDRGKEGEMMMLWE